MLSRTLFYIILVLILSIANTNCVSVDIQAPQIERAQNVSYEGPSHFSSFEQNHLDAAWKNESNGNTISYLSECNSTSDPSHEAIRDGIISGLQDVKVNKQEMIPFNNRKALSSTVSGSVDGVPTDLQILILKKNSCIYVLTYVGLKEKFNDDLDDFNKFVRGFTVP